MIAVVKLIFITVNLSFYVSVKSTFIAKFYN